MAGVFEGDIDVYQVCRELKADGLDTLLDLLWAVSTNKPQKNRSQKENK